MKHWTEYTPFEWLLVDIASRYGHDKWLFHQRIEWATQLIPVCNVKNMVELKKNLEPWIKEADEKPMFTGACIALFDTLNGKESSWQIGQDAASSGPQLLSVLGKCIMGMFNTGVLGEHMPDLYTSVTTAMNVRSIDRKIVKKGIVPHIYASEAAPKATFGTNYPKFLEAYKATVPFAQFAADAMVDGWDDWTTQYEFMAPDMGEIVLPVLVQQEKNIPLAGHTIAYRYDELGRKKKGERGTKMLSANTTHPYDAYMLRELNRRCNYDPVQIVKCVNLLNTPTVGRGNKEAFVKVSKLQQHFQHNNQISAVIFEYLDEGNVALLKPSIRKALMDLAEGILAHPPHEITNIHDEFKTLPLGVTNMKLTYNQLLVETYYSYWWFNVAKKLTGNDHSIAMGKIDESIVPSILVSPYSIG